MDVRAFLPGVAAGRRPRGIGVNLDADGRLPATVASPGVGRGSEFVVRQPAATTPQEAGPAAAGGKTSHGRRILIVENNRDGRESLVLLLGMLGHRVDLAEDGGRGAEVALAVRPEVSLIDIRLPKLDGFELTLRLRAGLGRGVLLVALTRHSQPEDRRRASDAGFDAHLTKPVELEELQRLLAHPLPCA